MIMISFLVSTYYISLLVWVFYYLFHSFGNPLPWLTCDNPWNTPDCVVYNRSNPNVTGTSPSEEYLKLVGFDIFLVLMYTNLRNLYLIPRLRLSAFKIRTII